MNDEKEKGLERLESSVVRKSNMLNESIHVVDDVEKYKLLYAMISNIKYTEKISDLARKEFVLNIKDFAKMKGIKGYYWFEEYVKDMVSYMKANSAITMRTEKGIRTFWIFDSVEFQNEKGDLVVKYRFTISMYEHILELKNKFFTYYLKNIMPMRSKYSIRLYELLKQYQNIGKREFDIDEFRELIGTRIKIVDERTKEVKILKDEYQNFKDLKKRAIDKAVEEINQYTDIQITNIEFKRYKRKIRYITFYFKGKQFFNISNDNNSIDVQTVDNKLNIKESDNKNKWLEIKHLRRDYLSEINDILSEIKKINKFHTITTNQILFFLLNVDRSEYEFDTIKEIIVRALRSKDIKNLVGFLLDRFKVDVKKSKFRELLDISKETDIELFRDIYDILVFSKSAGKYFVKFWDELVKRYKNNEISKETLKTISKIFTSEIKVKSYDEESNKIYLLVKNEKGKKQIDTLLIDDFGFLEYVKDNFLIDGVEIYTEKDLDIQLVENLLVYRALKGDSEVYRKGIEFYDFTFTDIDYDDLEDLERELMIAKEEKKKREEEKKKKEKEKRKEEIRKLIKIFEENDDDRTYLNKIFSRNVILITLNVNEKIKKCVVKENDIFILFTKGTSKFERTAFLSTMNEFNKEYKLFENIVIITEEEIELLDS